MDNVVDGMVIAALASALFSIFGFVRVIYPKWLQENCAARFYYGCIQIVVSMIVLSLGGLDCQPRPRISDILRVFLTGATFHIIRLCIMDPLARPLLDLW